ncbi:MAG: O-methyltransferase [Bacteroidota bacterium]
MPIHDPVFLQYLHDYSSPEPDILARLRRLTHLRVLYPQMLSDPAGGRLLSILSRLIRPDRILEIGTFTGYGTLCLAEGLAPGGHVDTIDKSDERAPLIRPFLAEAGLTDQVSLLHGRALDVVPDLSGPWDLVYLDADKANYPAYYQQILPKMNPGAYMLADNTLWHGKVFDEVAQDKESRGIRAFNVLVRDDPAVEQVLLPLGDGLTIIRKHVE